MEEGRDYDFVYQDNINAGTAKVAIQFKRNYWSGEIEDDDWISYTINPAPLANATTEIAPDQDLSYDGNEKTPRILVYLPGNNSPIPESDYEVTYANNTEKGTATYTISAKSGNVIGSINGTFEITKGRESINQATITITPESVMYTGMVPEITVTVKLNETLLKMGTDYTVAYDEKNDAGLHTLTVTGIGDYTGMKTANYTIAPRPISKDMVKIELSSTTYSGQPITPMVTVIFGDKTLVKDEDYSVEPYAIEDVGDVIITVKGIGNFTGTITQAFAIAPASIDDAVVTLSQMSFVYNGEQQKPIVEVEITLENGYTMQVPAAEYTLTFTGDTTNAGEVTVTVTAIEGGHFTGTAKMQPKYTIERKSIVDATVTVTAQIKDLVYTGSAITPTVKVLIDGMELTKDADYTVAYSNNVNVADNPVIVVSGKGNYIGEKTENFRINPASINDATVDIVLSSNIYTGDDIKPIVTASFNGIQLVEDQDYRLQPTAFKNAGDVSVTIEGKGNFTGRRESGKLTIDKASMNMAIIEVQDQVYTGDALTPVVTVKLGAHILTNNEDYTVEYANNIEIGTATVTVKGEGNCEGTKIVNFEILPNGVRVILEHTTYTYCMKDIEPLLVVMFNGVQLSQNDDYSISYQNNHDVGIAKVIVKGKGEYDFEKEVEFSIEPWNLEGVNLAFWTDDTDEFPLKSNSYNERYSYYTGTEKQFIDDIGIPKERPVSDHWSDRENYSILKKGVDYDLTYSNNKNVGLSTAMVTFKGNYAYGSTGVMTSPVSVDIRALNLESSSCEYKLASYEENFSGSQITPEIGLYSEVYHFDELKKEYKLPEENYTVIYGENKNPGTGSITIVPNSSNLTGTLNVSFMIISPPITSLNVEFTQASYTYSGMAITPEIQSATAKTEDTTTFTLTADNYDVSYSDNVNAGTGKATLTLKNGYNGTFESKFTINEQSLENAYVTTPKRIVFGHTESGFATVAEPHIVISTIVNDSYAIGGIYEDDYTRYKGRKKYEGYILCSFPPENTDPGWTDTFESTTSDGSLMAIQAPIYYHGRNLEPEIWVRNEKDFDEIKQDENGNYVLELSGKLVQNTDFTVTYENNKNAGEAIFRVSGIGNYKGEATGTFTISPASFDKSTAIWAKKETLVAGQDHDTQLSAIAENLIVNVADDVTLTPGVDFEIEPFDLGRRRYKPVEFTSGQFRINLKGKGNYAQTLLSERTIWYCPLLQPDYPNDLPPKGATLPKALVFIGDNAFAGTKLKVLDLRNTTVKSLTEGAFAGDENLKVIYLPATVSVFSELEDLKMKEGLWLIFDGNPEVSKTALDTLSYERGVFYAIQEATGATEAGE